MSISIQVSEHNSWRVLSLSGRVDAFSDKRLFAHLRQAAAEPSNLVLDLSRCEFLSLWSLRELVLWAEEIEKQDFGFALLTPADAVLRQLKVFLGNRIPISWDLASLEIESFYLRERKGPTIEPSYVP